MMLRVGGRKTVLLINSWCSAHFLKRGRPLLLHFLTPSVPIFPSQVWWSVPALVWPGCCWNHRIQIAIELVLNSSGLVIVGALKLTIVACLLPDKGSLSVTRRSLCLFEVWKLARCDGGESYSWFTLHFLQKKVCPAATSFKSPSSARRVSLRAAISSVYLFSSLPTSCFSLRSVRTSTIL